MADRSNLVTFNLVPFYKAGINPVIHGASIVGSRLTSPGFRPSKQMRRRSRQCSNGNVGGPLQDQVERTTFLFWSRHPAVCHPRPHRRSVHKLALSCPTNRVKAPAWKSSLSVRTGGRWPEGSLPEGLRWAPSLLRVIPLLSKGFKGYPPIIHRIACSQGA